MSRKVAGRLFLLCLCLSGLAVRAQSQTISSTSNMGGNIPAPMVLYDFGKQTGDPIDPELAYWAQGQDGNLYSTAPTGGANGDGAAFYFSPTGALTVLHSFMGTDGSAPFGGLTLGTDGNFYGTTSAGGANGVGTVFQINGTTFAFKTLYSFTNGSDGGSPYAPLVAGSNGFLYGTTATGGGTANCGTVYKITTSGTLTPLHQFTGSAGSDGCSPYTPLTLGNDGNFYGTTNVGGTSVYQAGTIFRISPAGTLKLLHSFADTDGYQPNGLVLGTDGNFYGTTSAGGGTVGYGVIFKITPAGTFTSLYTFAGGTGDGAQPYAGLVQATNGKFYGVTTYGGANGVGTIFGGNAASGFSVLYSFVQNTTGEIPSAPLFQRTDGLLYGDTFRGGSNGEGTFFSESLGLHPFVSLSPTSGKVGNLISIFGQGLTGSTAVYFGGTSALFSILSDTYITAYVPARAETEFVTLTTPGGTLTSNKKFRVTPQITRFSPTSGAVGTPVTITGQSLTQATKVTFGGVPATFTVDSDQQVTATVPTGAVTGRISIVTPGGTAASAKSFTVTP